MKILLASLILNITFSVLAANTCQKSGASIDLKVSDFQEVLDHGKKEFICDNLDIISGNYIMGAGQSVVVDSDQNIAYEVIQQGYPPFMKVPGRTFTQDPIQRF